MSSIFKLFLIFFCIIPTVNAENVNSKALVNAYRTKNWSYLQNIAKIAPGSDYGLLAKWLYLKDEKSNAPFEALANFSLKYPDFPEHKKIQGLAELRISYKSDPKTADTFCNNITPQIGNAIKVCNVIYASKTADTEKRKIFLKTAWINGDFTTNEEQEFFGKYNKILSENDHYQRTLRLYWQDKTTAAKAMHARLSKNHRIFFNSIVQVRNNKLPSIAPEHYKNPLMLYHLMKFYDARGKRDKTDDMIIQAGIRVPYPEKWIKNRRLEAREALDHRNYTLAYNLIKNHNLKDGVDFADSEWLAGWIALTHLKDYKTAAKHFHKMYEGVKYTMSKVRAAYWLGVSYAKQSNPEESKKWFEIAAKHPEQFFGQFALLKLGKKTFTLPKEPNPTKDDIALVKKNRKYNIARILLDAKEPQIAKQFLLNAIRHSKSKPEVYIFSKLPLEFNNKSLTVELAKEAAQNGHLFYNIGYPRTSLNFNPLIEKAIVYAITRQESNFNQYAKSSANAMGMMQLLPSTAKQLSKSIGVPYNLANLTKNPNYNMNLGQHYIHKLLNAYDSNLYLSIMAYNAGTGNVRKWIKNYGNPSNFKDYNAIINWIETTPFNETRNYVYRVLENLQVYRYIMNSKGLPQPIEIQEDLILR